MGSGCRLIARRSSLVEATPLAVQDAQEPARRTGRTGSWCSLLALQQPHVGGLRAFLALGDVELDGLPLIK
jgi:hypothetical protein